MRRNESGLGNQDCLETWTIDAAGVSRGMKWVPYADEKDRDRNVTWAAYLDENRLATCSAGGRLAIWDVETTRPICYLDVKGRPALSPDRKHLAFLVEGQVGVLDVEGQKVVALQAAPVSGGVLAFTPSGKRFVTLSGAELYVWDFATGQLQRECRLEGVHAGDELLCPSEEHLLAGSGRLYDFVNQVNVWDYRGYQKAGIAGGVCWLAVVAGERQPSALVPAIASRGSCRQARDGDGRSGLLRVQAGHNGEDRRREDRRLGRPHQGPGRAGQEAGGAAARRGRMERSPSRPGWKKPPRKQNCDIGVSAASATTSIR